jgi:lambda family phage portal protein
MLQRRQMRSQAKRAESLVKTTALDRAIAYVAPRAGLRRYEARARMALATGGGAYEGARNKRSMGNWNPSGGSADADVLPDLPDLRERSRDLVRNQAVASGALNRVQQNAVGSGLELQSSIDADAAGISEEEAADISARITRDFAAWANSDRCDAEGRFNFGTLQGLAFRSAFENGDAFGLLPIRGRDLKVRLIEADRVCNADLQPDGLLEDGGELAGGIEFDAVGRPWRCHILRGHPGALGPTAMEWDKVRFFGSRSGRRNLVHLMDPQRIGQSRGAPWFAPVLEEFRQLGEYTENELMATAVSSMLTVFTKTEGGQGLAQWDNDSSTSSDEGEGAELGNGAMVDLAPGEDIEVVDPNRPNSQYDAFVTAIVRQIGASLGLPYELLIQHFTSSYSASRAALLQGWTFFRGRREWLVDYFCQPIFEEWLRWQVVQGRYDLPGFMDDPVRRQAYLQADWVGPAPGQLDPVKETDAAERRVEYGFSTRTKEARSMGGGDYRANIRGRAKEEQFAREQEVGLGKAAESIAAPTDNEE